MNLVPLFILFNNQTAIVQSLGLYFSHEEYRAHSRDYQLLRDLQTRAQDVATICKYLEEEFRQREE
jgi:hypothetical protein